MGSNEKKNLIIMYSKFIILFEFIQEVDCHITIYPVVSCDGIGSKRNCLN
jgi:hypothetical protein